MRRRSARCFHMVFLVLAWFLLAGGAVPALAQQRPGAISGKVTDATGAVLKGAQITVSPAAVTVASNQQGNFFIDGLAPGSYTVIVTYVGFAPFTKTIEMTEGRGATVNAELQVQSQSQSVLVTAPRITGEAEALNIQRTAPNIVQVLPSEVIRSLPNANMADALGRLPSVTLERDEGEGKYVQVRGTEPRLTNTTVDGINVPSPEPGVRQIKFDAIPADIVERVDVSKTLLANMDGDGIGGSVDLITKTASSRPTVDFSSMGGYTPIINGRSMTEDTGTIGGRFGADQKFGFLIGGSYDWNGRGIDDVEPVPDVATLSNGKTMAWNDAMDIREYQYFRSRWGIAGSADDKISAGSDISLRWLYSDFKNNGDRWAYSLTDNTTGIQLLNPDNVGCGTNDAGVTVGPCGGTASYGAELRQLDISLGNLVLEGSHALSNAWLSWNVSAGRSFYGDSPSSDAKFSSPADTSDCEFDPSRTTNPFIPQWSAACYAEAYDPTQMQLTKITRDLGHAEQLNLEGGGSAAKLYHWGSHSATLEAGAKVRNEHKYSDTYKLTLKPTGDLTLADFPNRLTNDHYYLGDAYQLGYNASYEDMIAFADANPGLFTSSSTQGSDASNFTLDERIGAGYVMNTVDLSNNASLIAGVRLEHTSDQVRNFSLGKFACGNATCSSITPNTFSGSYLTVLPSISYRYAIDPHTNLRFVYSRGLSRPDPESIAKAESWGVSANGANRYSVSLGNANLKAETGDDLDVLFDHYLDPFGEISAGYFYKHLENPIVTHSFFLDNYQPAGGPLANYLATQPVNAGSAWISGIELAYMQHFGFLPGVLGGLGVSANYGYTASGTTGIPGRSDHPPLLRTSPSAFNLSPTYDRGRISARVGMSYNQASIYDYQYADGTPGGLTGPLGDIYFYSHFQVDAQGSVKVAHGLNVVVAGLNLNNEVFGFYQGSSPYNIQREYYRPTFEVGLRWSPGL